ncbi:transmembrane protein [Rhynchospora pubera]|uniref:Transmembrane protein n=1 Tax=Rhynchospora pubera TaxID=906938 RepID=A0AAV8HBE1_9POAL|nr:transmembrane protein [Rhynchospora pubera]
MSALSASPSVIPPKYFGRLRLRLVHTTLHCSRPFPISSLAIASHSPFSDAVDASQLTSAVASPPAAPPAALGNLGPRHMHMFLLNATACVVALSSCWLFLSAIPTLLAFRKALESVEKLLDVTAEELPDTMASVRLSGMEISDLTRELTDLGEEMTEGVRRSTRPLRVAEERFHQLTTMNPQAMVQGQNGPMENTKRPTPEVAKAARELRESISRGRETFELIGNVIGFSRWAFGRGGGRKKHK